MRSTTLDNLLDMASCLEDYGLRKPMMIDFLLGIIEQITTQEIDSYCSRAFLSEEARANGYSQEDFDVCRENLLELLAPIIVEGE